MSDDTNHAAIALLFSFVEGLGLSDGIVCVPVKGEDEISNVLISFRGDHESCLRFYSVLTAIRNMTPAAKEKQP